ncbi:MAG: NAD-dependent 4,6-dehydratase LegB [Pseudomonadota bacterium]|nr:NAD-dependent 4,6-dehydratase LegB [Pseudomonadota bacterium]
MRNNEIILITGADGFIGSHLAEIAVQKGFKVRALCQYNSFSSWGWLDNSPYNVDMEIIMGDIRDPNQMRKLVKNTDMIFHLAALIAIPYSYQATKSYIDTNIQGTLNVIEAARDENVSKVIQTSTSEVYGTARYTPIDEAHPLQAQSPYSATKISADALVTSFYNSFKLPAIIARPFNTFGPRQSARAVIPTVITQLLNGVTTLKLGSIYPKRDFNFVQDTCNGILALANCENAIGKTVNIGSGNEISIENTVKTIAKLMQIDVEIECEEQRLRPENSEVDRLLCDNSLIKELTGYMPQFTFEEGLIKTIDWLRKPETLAHYKADIYNV